MGKRTRTLVIAASLATASVPAGASVYPAMYNFGDSLSDVGNVYVATGGAYPVPQYTDGITSGRFTNGKNWVDDLSADLGLGSVLPSILGGNDFAVGGAQTGTTLVHSDVTLVDLDQQVLTFQALKPSPVAGALYTLDIGANDIGAALSALASNAITPADLPMFLADAIGNTVTAVGDLFADGARNLLFYEVPDLSLVPAFEAAGPLGGMLAQEFNQGVLQGIARLEGGPDGLTVFDLPIFSEIDAIVKDPGAFELTNAQDPCFSGDPKTPGTVCDSPDTYLFWDHEHPTAAGHALTAGFAEKLLTPVPEASTWEMLLSGFAGLGLVGWRARRVRPITVRARG